LPLKSAKETSLSSDEVSLNCGAAVPVVKAMLFVFVQMNDILREVRCSPIEKVKFYKKIIIQKFGYDKYTATFVVYYLTNTL
jgi:hypothetical protein